MLARRMNQDRSEGLDGDPKEKKLAKVRSLIWGSKILFATIAADANLSVSTVSKYAHGETRRPHDNTTECILKALGYKQVIVPVGIEVAAEVRPQPHWPADLNSLREKRRLKRKATYTKKRRQGRRRK